MRKLVLGTLCLALSALAHAEMKKTQFTASNGVIVNVSTDDFAGRREYSSPFVRFEPDGGGTGEAMVGEVFNEGKLTGLTIQGFVIYSGEWRFYKTAIFKGGAPADFHSTGHDVGSCSYGCSLSEGFMINITPQQAAAHVENGSVAIQIRGNSANTAIINIPLSYFQAVSEVAH